MKLYYLTTEKKVDLLRRERDVLDLAFAIGVRDVTVVSIATLNGGKAGVYTEVSAHNAAELLLDGKALLSTSKYPCHLRPIPHWCDYDRSIEQPRVRHGGFMRHTCQTLPATSEDTNTDTLTTFEREFSTGLTPAQIERFALLLEECGEVQQMIGKILRHGLDSVHPDSLTSLKADSGNTNRHLLEVELGDMIHAINLLTQNHDLNTHSIETAKRAKAARVWRYLHHQ